VKGINGEQHWVPVAQAIRLHGCVSDDGELSHGHPYLVLAQIRALVVCAQPPQVDPHVDQVPHVSQTPNGGHVVIGIVTTSVFAQIISPDSTVNLNPVLQEVRSIHGRRLQGELV
jgi:hypothetical protein